MIRKTVGRKLTTAVGLTVLVIVSTFAYVNIRSHEDSLLAEVERHAIQVSQTVKSSTEYDMLLNEPSRIHEIIKRLGEEDSIERIRIMNKAGKITYSSDVSEIGKTVNSRAESCSRCHAVDPPLERLEMRARTRVFRRPNDSSRALGVITPIYNKPSCWTADLSRPSEIEDRPGRLRRCHAAGRGRRGPARRAHSKSSFLPPAPSSR